MARAYLSAEERREQILDHAQALFFEKGYDRTTVQDLMAAAGVSKGGFYHHFSAKEDVLEAINVRLAAVSVKVIEEVLARPGLTAFEQLDQSLRSMRRFKREQASGIIAAFETLLRPENISLYDRINRANITTVLPLFEAIIEAGRQDGSFDVPDARIAAQAILSLGSMSHDTVAKAVAARDQADRAAANAALERALVFQGVIIDRILGLPDGSIQFVEPGFVDALLPPEG
ncbi:TetR/AcrR family transcriptional regulator [Devosia sp. XJ19-1]|uniref:TetR/AcrR family transcriptional regulator n=1 Tax=Devosia ureilytica TaxID=2952754 RepID=A0A9Q4AQ54_9HYPH|nr:TetR/AcrR family transcriptional regulator [Devosia ureilytica]MCP8884271.1 TetR/AcrR family transcriptional regulator [Devosia ureilytica]MCP8887879.1 TetR/AcrR family transcriptional regulator [Devosia ureilytica]